MLPAHQCLHEKLFIFICVLFHQTQISAMVQYHLYHIFIHFMEEYVLILKCCHDCCNDKEKITFREEITVLETYMFVAIRVTLVEEQDFVSSCQSFPLMTGWVMTGKQQERQGEYRSTQ